MPTIYSNEASGNSYKARLLASFLNIPLDIIQLDLRNGEQRGEKFLAINPKGEVPTLVDGDLVLTDSAAILVYLAGKYHNADGNDWWSVDIAEQVLITNWLAFAASWVQYGVFTARAIVSLGGAFNGLGTASTEQTLREARIRGEKSLQILDQHLGSVEWLMLGRPTIADIAVFPYVALAPMGDISLEPFGNVRSWIGQIRELSRFIPIDGLDDPLYLQTDRST